MQKILLQNLIMKGLNCDIHLAQTGGKFYIRVVRTRGKISDMVSLN